MSVTLYLAPQTIPLPKVVVRGANISGSIKEQAPGVRTYHFEASSSSGSTVTDLLKEIPELQINETAPGQGTLRLQGALARQVLVMIDGVPIKSALGQSTILQRLTPAQIAQIEILPGNQTARFGPDAMGGVINFVTRRTFSSTPQPQLKWRVGSFGEIGGEIDYEAMLGDWRFRSFSRLLKVRNNYSYPFETQWYLRENAGNRQWNVGLSLDGVVFNWQTVVQYELFNQKQGLPGPVYEWTPSAQRQLKGQSVQIVFKYHLSQSRKLEITGRWDGEEEIDTSGATPLYPPWNKVYQNNTILWRLRWHQRLAKRGWLNFAAQGEFEELTGEDKLVPRFSLGNHNRRNLLLSGSFSRSLIRSNVKWLPKIDLTGALGWHSVSDYPEIWTWSAGLSFIPTQTSHSWRLEVEKGHGFSLPTFWQRFWVGDAFSEGNPDLEPEWSDNLNVTFTLKWERYVSGNLDLRFFQQDYRNLITWRRGYANRFYPVNLAKAQVKGATLVGQLTFLSGKLVVDGNYTLTDPINKTPGPNSYGRFLPFRALSNYRSSLRYVYRDFECKLILRGQGRTYIREANTKALAPFHTLDIQLSTSWKWSTWDFKPVVEVRNITDVHYQVLERYPLPGRNFLLTVEMKHSPK